MIDTAPVQPTAVLVAVVTQKQTEEQATEYLNELEFLAETAGIRTLKKFRQKLERPHPRTFVGKGKLEEIQAFVQAEKPTMVIFDDELSSSQMRNLEKELKCKILDRTMLIIEIFLLRAKTVQARTQVELAQMQYMLPRLTRMWTHLSRQQGGVGVRGGPGESELETDRRIVRDKIALLREKLNRIEKQGETQRKSRETMVRVALVGYTNVGKSTLMNLLTKADVFAENKLFATVDATVRKVVIDQIPFLLTDTVGFIRKLPTHLVESFKSTLSEIVEADILLHVVDISHPSFEEQIEVVNKTLAEIGAGDKTVILVLNKIDAYQNPELEDGAPFEEHGGKPTLEQLKATYLNRMPRAVFISAAQKINIDELRQMMMQEIAKKYFSIYPNFLNRDLMPEYLKGEIVG
ncbi:GTPase HflX [Rhodoflexus caldus]|uniref:GTPase HflX n=1 Tax=Rhodoflexus caldus TaxID=2891236 RepID=UPI00202AAB50|nr:GTPase HflX [Rhodoflexus caldus]